MKSVVFLEPINQRIWKNGKHLIRGSVDKQLVAALLNTGSQLLRQRIRALRDIEIQIVAEQLVELKTDRASLREQPAPLPQVEAKVILELRVYDHDSFPDQRTIFRPADIKHVDETRERGRI